MRFERRPIPSLPDRQGPVDLFEAPYRVHASPEAWLEGVVASAGALDRGLGVLGVLQRFSGGELETLHLATRGRAGVSLVDRLSGNELPLDHLATGPLTRSGSVLRELGEVGAEVFGGLADLGVADAAAHMARAGELFLTLVAPSPELVSLRGAERRRAHRLTTHLATGLRLRTRLAHGDVAPELVFSPEGQALSVERSADEVAAPELLLEVGRRVRAVERARGPLRDDEPERASSLWRALVEGRWSLAERVERSGQRFVLAFRNELGAEGPSALSPRERDVVAWAAGGASLKEVGYAMGLATSTVGEHLKSAMRKLKVESRAELAMLWMRLQAPEPGAGLASVGLDGEDVFVGNAAGVAGLSEAEREVARRAARGESSAEIARARGTSLSTVTNQLGAIYRKLGVGSKTELAAWVVGRRGRP